MQKSFCSWKGTGLSVFTQTPQKTTSEIWILAPYSKDNLSHFCVVILTRNQAIHFWAPCESWLVFWWVARGIRSVHP